MIGYCATCAFRDDNGRCTNPKISEDETFPLENRDDMLIYSYSESGYFWVGPHFGCVHHQPK